MRQHRLLALEPYSMLAATRTACVGGSDGEKTGGVNMPWWMWAILGLFLLILEVQTFSGFYVMFFGIGALLVGALVAAGSGGPPSVQWLLFSVLSLVALSLFRRPIMQRLAPSRPGREVDSMLRETAIASEDIASGAVGKVELRGSSWSARNVGPSLLAKSQRCRVERVDELMLSVRAEGPEGGIP
jgi:membrane protein implicated in regulation of membrane protease activity